MLQQTFKKNCKSSIGEVFLAQYVQQTILIMQCWWLWDFQFFAHSLHKGKFWQDFVWLILLVTLLSDILGHFMDVFVDNFLMSFFWLVFGGFSVTNVRFMSYSKCRWMLDVYLLLMGPIQSKLIHIFLTHGLASL